MSVMGASGPAYVSAALSTTLQAEVFYLTLRSVAPSAPTTADTTSAATPAPSTTTTALGSDIEISTGTTILASLPSTGAHGGFDIHNPLIQLALLLTVIGGLILLARRSLTPVLHD